MAGLLLLERLSLAFLFLFSLEFLFYPSMSSALMLTVIAFRVSSSSFQTFIFALVIFAF